MDAPQGLAVALDYMDIHADEKVIGELVCNDMEKGAFLFTLHEQLPKGLIQAIQLHYVHSKSLQHAGYIDFSELTPLGETTMMTSPDW